MDPRLNPYTPNAGAIPPVLVGRQDEMEAFEVLLDRLRAGRTEQSMIITGLRGVGKTVLLTEFGRIAADRNWVAIEMEIAKHDDNRFRLELARECRRALLSIAPRQRWGERARRAARVLRSFSLSVDPDGRLTAGFGVDALEGYGDSGFLSADVQDLMVSLGEVASEHSAGVILLFDEIQLLETSQFEALIVAIHKIVQRSLPLVLVAAGLPQLPALAGEAKSYSERLFRFPGIGSLNDDEARLALSQPASDLGLEFLDGAIGVGLDFTEGFPYFIQEFGQAAWNLADSPHVTVSDAEKARLVVEEKLDSNFFRVRLDRTTELQRAYLRAMAELGPNPQRAAAVAKVLNRTTQQCGTVRSQLIEKGLLYQPQHGDAAFTVPHFDRHLKRTIPQLIVPPIRRRKAEHSLS